MLDLRCAATKDDSAEQPRKPQLPPQIRLREGPGTTDSDNQCRSVLLSNIAQCVNGSHLRNSFIRWGSPLIREVNMFMSDEKTPSHCLHAASGLSLLLCSCKAYCFALPAGQSPAKCRVQALRFAQDAVAQISLVLDDSTMPCRCIGTLASHLENLKRELEEYLRSKMFDLFFQSPWVCGGHVLEMMHALRYYGLRLVAYRSYVGSVAHMYNVLRQIHGLDPIPVLEAMCEHLEDLFFPGGQPKKNFRACYVRYLGGRLRFHGKARHQNGCHALAIPAHTAKATAGLSSGSTPEADPRFDCGRFSLLHRLRDSGYRFDEASILPVAHFRKTSSSSSSNTPTGTATASNLQALHQALDAELTSPSFPNATFNFLSIYLICARIVDRISDAYHDPDAKKGQYCLCCAEGLVMAADGFREGKGWRVRKEIRELARVCTEVMKEELGGKKVDEFVWINL
ncbi:MAG: hypothetical protein L6R39_004533 [Caloplaca ligustica]|nr:MAG: hypothetical protein L6R39_004533 [Caloplaca ligustica]